MIVSVHAHKTAGTFLREILRQTYGDKLLLDYEHPPTRMDKPFGFDPLNCWRGDVITRVNENIKGKEMVHGHFHVKKYEHTDASYVTLLRHPIDRLISQYLFAKDFTVWSRKNYSFVEPIYEYVYDMDLSVVDFANIIPIKHFYTRTYFEAFDMKRFELIGDYDNIEKYLKKLGRLTGKDMASLHKPKPQQSYSADQQAIKDDKDTIEQLEELLVEDIAFYNKWVGRGL